MKEVFIKHRSKNKHSLSIPLYIHKTIHYKIFRKQHTTSFHTIVHQLQNLIMPGIMMNSYSSSSRKTMRRSCCIRSRTSSTNSCSSASSSYFTPYNDSARSAASTSSSIASSRTNSVNMNDKSYNDGSVSPKALESTRSLDTYFAKTNKEQRKSEEWGHFVDL